MTECAFCRIYAGKQGIIYENELFFAQFDSFPVNPGHAEIVPKRHVASLLDLTEQEWMNLKPAITNSLISSDMLILYSSLLIFLVSALIFGPY